MLNKKVIFELFFTESNSPMRSEDIKNSSVQKEKLKPNPTNTLRLFHVETTWKPSFPHPFNVEYRWCVCREAGYPEQVYKMAKRNKGKNNDKQTNGADEGSVIIVD